MEFKTIIQVLGHLLMFLAFILLFPAGLAYKDDGVDLFPFLESIGYTFSTGLLCTLLTRKSKIRLSPKEGFAIVTIAWLFMTFFGALPFYLTKLPGDYQFSFCDAFFETMSGLTTTGASILSNIEGLPRGLLLWRSLTHWIGGMGIIVLFLAILPALGAGGFQLFRAEIPGPTKDKISPKIGSTAKTLWAVYVGLTAMCFFVFERLGMSPFDAACHAFSTIATGGFSTKNNSMAYWGSWELESAATVFMFLSGCNFMLYLQMMKGKWKVPFKNSEFKLYVTLIFFSIIGITWFRMSDNSDLSLLQNFREVSFTVVAVITSTGFATTDYDLWPAVCFIILVILMCTGGCAGSTSGGIKVFRIFIVIKIGIREITQLLHPRAIISLKMDGQGIQDRLLRVILGFVCLYFILFGFFALIIVGIEGGNKENLVSLLSTCISCLSNIGPGLDAFGPTDNYGELSDISKYCLCFLMLLGRLEIYSVLVLFHRSLWRK